MTTQTLLLIDGHSMAFRSFFALPADSFRTAQGQYTNAVHGFLSTLLRLINDYKPTHIAVAFDLPGGTFRTRQYADYKGGRAKTPEEFKGQISVIQEVLDVLGIRWLTVEDFEADDIVATLASRGKAADMRVYIASGDKDSYQLVDETTSVIYPMPRSHMLLMTPEVVEERTGVAPSSYSDLAALVGEKADNLPGVPGVGPKTAAKWLKEYGDLESLLDHADEIKGKAGESLRAHSEQVRRNRALNALVRDLPIVPDLADLIPVGVDRANMHELFDTLDFTTLRNRVINELPAREGSTTLPEDTGLTLRTVTALTAENMSLGEFLESHAGPYGLSWEGSGKPGAGSVDQFAIAAEDGSVWYGDTATLSPADDDTLTTFLADESLAKTTHGGKALWHAWRGNGKSFAGVTTDTELDAYLLHPDQRRYDLPDLVDRFLGISLDSGAEEQTLGISLAGEIDDPKLTTEAVATLDLADAFTRELAKHGQSNDLVTLEIRVSEILAQMENRGIAVDLMTLDRLWAEFNQRVADAADRAYSAIGDRSVNLSSPKQLQSVLFDDLGLPKTKKTKSGYTTNAEALNELLIKIATREDDAAIIGRQFLSALLEHRDAIKLRQSVEGLQRSVQADKRIRTTYQQTVAATGRLSSTDPNLQNIHARTPEGLQIREVFVPGEGFDSLMTADYSQIEMRLMAHLSGDAELIAAFNDGADLHSYVAARVFGIAEDEVSPAQRSKIKAMSYGLVYGLSAFGLSAQLRIPVPEASRLMDDYFTRFGKVKVYLDSLVSQACKDGYTETILGRRRYLPELSSTNRQIRESAERMALNAPIQGSAADIIKLAMCQVEDALADAGLRSRILLQVHDELVLEIVDSEAADVEAIVRENMGNVLELSVPLTVSVGIGATWRAAAH